MKKRLHLPASSLSANIRFLNKFARTNSTVKLLTKVGGGGGERLGFSWSVTKAWPSTSKALEISSAKFCRQSSTRKINLEFFTRADPFVPPKMADFAPQRNLRYTSGFPFLPYRVFLPLPLESVRTVGVRSYADVITNFFRIHRFPQVLLISGASLRALRARGRSTIYSRPKSLRFRPRA